MTAIAVKSFVFTNVEDSKRTKNPVRIKGRFSRVEDISHDFSILIDLAVQDVFANSRVKEPGIENRHVRDDVPFQVRGTLTRHF